MAVIDLKKCTIQIEDGGSEALEVKVGQGNLTYTEARNIEYILDKGSLDEVREGDEIPMDVRFDFTWVYLISATSTGTGTPTVEEAIKGNGAAADWVSSDTANACAPYAVDITVAHDPTTNAPAGCTGDTETSTLADFRWEQLEHDLRGGSVACSGKCNATLATHVRA